MDIAKINNLRSTIERYNCAYRTGNPQISDAEYDALIDELRQLDPNNDWFKRIEPSPVSSARKIKLPIPMKSLDKAKTLEEVKQWVNSLNLENPCVIITPKFDGVSLLYNQKTGQAYSRGGAENEGQDCTAHAAKVGGIMRNSLKSEIEYTYGELVFRVNAWESYFKGYKSKYSGLPYKSPRNTIAGFINRELPDDELTFATFFRYGVDEEALKEFDTYDELYRYLCSMGGLPSLYEWSYANNLNEALLQDCFDKWSKEFYIDGLVIYIDDLSLWKQIGRHQTTGNPKYAIAYKNPDFAPIFESTVKSVSWKMSKSGALKPVVNIDTVDTGDCEMENPTGYNAKYIFENGIGAEAVIKVTRSGGIIPKILEVIEEASPETMARQREDLLYCPHCGKPIVWNDSQIELICTNPECPGIVLAKICHFYNILDAEQMGEETITKMYKAGYNTLCRILDITFEELMLIDGFGESIANNILSINQQIRKGVEVTKLMHASDCFTGIGQIKAQALLATFSKDYLYAFVNGYLSTVPDFEQSELFSKLNKTGQSFVKGIAPFYEFIAFNKLKVLPFKALPATVEGKYSGMRVCFTGVRDKELEELIVSQGGALIRNVSKNTTHLIVGAKSSQSVKAKKARALGIPIMTIKEFRSL